MHPWQSYLFGKIKLVAEQGVSFGLCVPFENPRVASLQGLLTAERVAKRPATELLFMLILYATILFLVLVYIRG
jgi:hypothetical protein